MKKIILVLIMIILSGCAITKNTETLTEFNENEMRKVIKKDIIKSGKVYFSEYNYSKEKAWKYDTYNSIEESIANQLDKSAYGYNNQKIDKLLYKNEYKNGLLEIFYISKLKNKNKDGFFVNRIYKEGAKYSEVLSIPEPETLNSNLPINHAVSITELLFDKLSAMGLPVENEPNRFYGITSDKEIYTLKIEGQKPDKIVEFEANDRTYYFWVYNDIKSKKEVDKYTIEYKGKKD